MVPANPSPIGQGESGLALGDEAHGGAHTQAVPFAQQDRRGVRRGGALHDDGQQARQQLVQRPRPQRLAREAIDGAQHPLVRRRVVGDGRLDRVVQDPIDDPHVRHVAARRIGDDVHDALAKDGVLRHQVAQQEPTAQAIDRVKLGRVAGQRGCEVAGRQHITEAPQDFRQVVAKRRFGQRACNRPLAHDGLPARDDLLASGGQRRRQRPTSHAGLFLSVIPRSGHRHTNVTTAEASAS